MRPEHLYDPTARSHGFLSSATSTSSTLPQRAMASSSNKGAAEEPEPEPGPPSPSPSPSAAAAVPPYDPREYQPAHPDDRIDMGL